VAWWDPTDTAKLTASGSQVTGWTDEIGALAMSPQGTNAASIVTTTLGGVRAISFPGSNAYLSNPSTPAGFPLDVTTLDGFLFAVLKPNVAGSIGFAPSVLNFGGLPLQFGISGPSNTSNPVQGVPQMTQSGSYVFWSSGASIDGVSHTLEARYGVSGVPQMWTDGNVATAGSAISPTTLTGASAVEIGRRSTGEYLSAIIGDIIVGKNLSTSDRQKIEGYLAWKWALTANLPAGHPYKTSPPTA
jgi:hypothetical protein